MSHPAASPGKSSPKMGMQWTHFLAAPCCERGRCWGRSSARSGGTGDTPQPPLSPQPQSVQVAQEGAGARPPARSEPHGAEGLSESLRLPPGPGERSSRRRCVPAGAAGASAPSCCCCCCSVSWGRGHCGWRSQRGGGWGQGVVRAGGAGSTLGRLRPVGSPNTRAPR